MKAEVVLGKIIEGEAFRDAVHIAVAPVVAGEPLIPGEHVGQLPDGTFGTKAEKKIGIVDPFLMEDVVNKGQQFYLCLYPQTITSLRHVWTHPAFKAKLPEASRE